MREKLLERIVDSYHTHKIDINFRCLTTNLRSIDIKKPIWLLGVQGGGGTLLSRILRRSKNVVGICGGSKRWTKADELHNTRKFKRLPDDFVLRGPGHLNLLGNEVDHPIFGKERSFLYAIDEFFPEYRRVETNSSPAKRNQFVTAIKKCIRAYSLDLKAARFHDMSQSYTLKVPLLNLYFPDSKFILLIRDPYAICWRQAKKLTENKFLNRRVNMDEALRYSVNHYKNTYETCLRDLEHVENCMIIRYEDILENLEKSILNMCEFTELPYMESLLPGPNDIFPFGSNSEKEKWYPIRKDINALYRSEITAKAKDYIESEVPDLISNFNYIRP